MSQKAHQDEDVRRSPTRPPRKQDKLITGLSPNDPIGITSDDTGKPPEAPPPPTPVS